MVTAEMVFSAGAFMDALRERGMTPAEFIDELGCGKATVAKWLTGEAVPKSGNLKQAARILGVDPADLME